MKNEKVKKIAYWLTTVLGPASFVIGGTLSLMGADQVVTTLQHLGYPAYFAMVLGVSKLLGAIVVAAPGLPRLKEWAYAGFVFDLTAAAFSHASVSDSTGDVVAPIVFLGLVLASWALRPESRRLANPASQPRAATVSTANGVLAAPAGA